MTSQTFIKRDVKDINKEFDSDNDFNTSVA
jgi:hypothetical protein